MLDGEVMVGMVRLVVVLHMLLVAVVVQQLLVHHLLQKRLRLVEMVCSLNSLDLQQLHNLQEIQVHMEAELPHHLVVDGLVVEEQGVVPIQHQVDLLEVVMVVVQRVDMFHGQIMGQVIMLWKTLVEVDLEHLEIHTEVDQEEVVYV
jgi:hypothetical protein